MKTKKLTSTTLAFFKFKLALTAEIRTAHYCWAAFEYSSRWWKDKLQQQSFKLTTDYPGDSGRPFSSISIPPSDFIGRRRDDAEAAIRENAIINIHTAFETYLADTTRRAVFLKPSLLDKSGMQIEVKGIAPSIEKGNTRRYLADLVIARYIYNKSHTEMVDWIDIHFKCGIVNGEKRLFSDWQRWSKIRNSLIHAGRNASSQLVEIWPTRFALRKPSPRLDNCDVVSCHSTAYSLAAALDKQIVHAVIGEEDSSLLARELFVRHGITDPGELSRLVDRALNSKYSKNKVSHVIAQQKRSEQDPSKEFDFTDEMLLSNIEPLEPELT